MLVLKGWTWLIFTPFCVPVILVAVVLIFSIDLANNTYPLYAMFTIVVGFLVGVTALFLANSLSIWWRLLIGLLYLPAVLFSMIAAGF